MKILIYTIVLIGFSIAESVAQTKDLASIDYSVATVKYNDTTAQSKLLDVKFKVPLFTKNRYVVLATFGYKNVNLNNFPKAYTDNLHGFTAQAVWVYKMANTKSLVVFTQVGLFSDLKDLSGKDFRYSAGFRYRVKHCDKLSTGWGLAYSRQFFGSQIIPFIDVDYKPNEDWSITGQFPVKPEILYHFNPKISAGIELNADASSYRLSSTERDNMFLQINQWAGLIKMEYQFAKSWLLNLGIGKNFKQSYKLYNDTQTQRWTIITVPLGEKNKPVYEIDNKGLNVQMGVSFNPF